MHPINNEPVGRVGCGEVIFGFFLILSLYFFLKEKKYLSLITYFLALLSKEMAVMLPFALLIFAIQKDGYKKGIFKIIPYGILIGIYLALRSISFDTTVKYDISLSIFAKILTMIVAAFDYIRLLVIPYHLSPYYPSKWYTSIFGIKAVIAVITLLSVFILALKFRKDKTMFFLLLSPFIMLAPVIWMVNRFPIGDYEFAYIAERFLYVPLMFFSLFAAVFIAKVAAHVKRQYAVIIRVMVIITFASAAASSNMIWEDNFTLFSKIVMDSPKAAFAHNNLGNAYLLYGRFNEAIKEYEIALKLKPDFTLVYVNRGSAYFVQSRFDKAIKEFLTAIEIDPNYADAHYKLGLVYKEKGLKGEAKKEFEIALKIDPNHAKASKELKAKH